MVTTARRLRCTGAALLGVGLLLLGACTSQRQAELSALHYFEKGNAAYQAEDYGRAIEHFRMALQFDPAAPDIHYNLGLSHYRAGAWEDAAQAFQRAVDLDADFALAHLNLALSFDKLYNSAAAHLHYNRYRELANGAGAAGSETAGASPRAAQAAPATARVPTGGQGFAGARPAAAGQQPAQTSASARNFQPLSQIPSAAAAAGTAAGSAAPGQARQAPPPARTDPANPPLNPYEGNAKWWTQDAANPNR